MRIYMENTKAAGSGTLCGRWRLPLGTTDHLRYNILFGTKELLCQVPLHPSIHCDHVAGSN